MEDLFEKIKKNILEKKLINSKDKIIVGVSGGPDSIFLLNILHKLKDEKIIDFEIEVAHINHMIREQAADDEKMVREISNDMGYRCHVLKANIPIKAKEQKISEEECGRNIRYEFFEKLLKERKANKIAVAHNQTDNAETVLMNFIRGTGINGLSGMDYIYGNIIRPMLNIKKQKIIEFLEKHNICYAIDITNNENKYTRNRIRNDLIKKIENEYNPNFLETIQRMIELNKQDEILIMDYVDKEYDKLSPKTKPNNIVINTIRFFEMSNACKCRIVRKILNELLGNIQGIEKVHVDDIVKLLNKNITNKKYIIGNKFTVTVIKKNVVEFKLNI